MKKIEIATVLVLLMACTRANSQNSQQAVYKESEEPYHETYRPQIHFSPKQHWMNDPNGMVYFKGIYHLFFQYYPGGTVWGPMHWGHATSRDLVHWSEQP